MTITITLKPIVDAPVRKGDEFGPCILAVGSRWHIGYWNGERWFDRRGDTVMPSLFGLLPPTVAQLYNDSAQVGIASCGSV